MLAVAQVKGRIHIKLNTLLHLMLQHHFIFPSKATPGFGKFRWAVLPLHISQLAQFAYKVQQSHMSPSKECWY